MGVGFSYCSRQLDGNANENGQAKPCANTDTSTAEASRAALVDFFATKFPELKEGGFYIAGESYAGVYIPTLSNELLTNEDALEHVPLKGILVGDPCTDNAAQQDSMDAMWYSRKYGLMDNEVYDVLQSEDCAPYRSKVLENYMVEDIAETNIAEDDDDDSSSTSASPPIVGTHSSKSHQSVGKQWSGHVTASDLNEELIGI